MTETAEGRKPIAKSFADGFKSLTPKQWIAIAAGLILALVLEVFMGSSCVGFFVAAVALYMIPHMMGVSAVSVKAVVGVIFVVVALVIGTFGFTGTMATYEDLIDTDTETIRDVEYIVDPATGESTLTFYVNPSIEDWDVLVQYVEISGIAFGSPAGESSTLGSASFGPPDYAGEETYDYTLTLMGEGDTNPGWYRGELTGITIPDGSAYLMQVSILTSENSLNASLRFMVNNGANPTTLGFIGSGYTVAYAAVIYFLILGFSAIMRRSAEKTRAKMEAEGRLYPQGYGRCKQCGAMVLPGEVNCRKCGAYIDVPEEIRANKKDFFECSECGAEVPMDAVVCPKCGAKFDEDVENVVIHQDGTEDVSTETVVCPDCGNIVPSNAEWCPRCGKILHDKKD